MATANPKQEAAQVPEGGVVTSFLHDGHMVGARGAA